MSTTNQEPDCDPIRRLVSHFSASETTYTSLARGYQEAEVRSEFIDPLLEAFGWDTANRAGVDPAFRQVLREETQHREDSHSKKPDYTLRDGRRGLLYVEAKKPSVDILRDMDSIRQARAYGYTEGHPIVVLTNFRDLSVYDATVPSFEDDLPESCRLFTWHFTDYEAQQEEIAAVLGRSSVLDPAWPDQFTSTRPNQAIPADQKFVQRINVWRKEIGANIVRNHPHISGSMLNDVVHKLINRLVFVRMCEDRGIEGEATLRAAATGQATDIDELFKRLDRRYNTGLFDQTHPSAEPAPLVDADLLSRVIDSLYSPRSPFSFAVLDANFLGLVYETSLSEQLEITFEGGVKTVRLAEKLEYAKRDVVTTPQQLVSSTVEEAWKSLPFDPSKNPKVLDFAVGSGRFLLSAFNQYLETWTQYLIDEDPSRLLRIGESELRLPFGQKRKILEENFFGIDVDYNAVEVARFSLLIRLLEDETVLTLPPGGEILPNLDRNIIHGNTLVRELPDANEEQLSRAAPLDFKNTALPEEFDFIIGNPPYMQTKEMKSYNRAEYNYLKANYELLHQQFDKYFAFLEFALSRTTATGVVSVVIPNKWMTNVAGEKLRTRLLSKSLVTNLANFRHSQIFEGKSIYVCALTLTEGEKEEFVYSEPSSIVEHATGLTPKRRIPYQQPPPSGGSAWVLPANDYEASVLSALKQDSIPLSNVVSIRNGIQTSKNRTYILTDFSVGNGQVSFSKAGRKWVIEEAVTRPYLEDSRTISSYRFVVPDARVIYPYRHTDLAKNSSGFEIIPMDEMQQSYPKAYAYLVHHQSGMSGRDMGNTSSHAPFYAYGRVQAIGYAVDFPKILYSVNQTGKKYGLDETGIVFSSGGTAGEAALYPTDSGYSLDFILALLDQVPIEFYLRKRGSPFRGGYVSRGTDVVEGVPVPRIDFTDKHHQQFHDQVSNTMAKLRQLVEADHQIAPSNRSQHEGAKATLKGHLDQFFAERWGLDVDDYGQLNL